MLGDMMYDFIETKAISDKLCLWCTIVDTSDYDRMAEVFSETIVWDFGKGTVDHGLDQVGARIKAHLSDPSQCSGTHHHLANVRIDVDGNTATSEAYFFAAHGGMGSYEGQVLLQWGNYRDTWQRGIDGWRITIRDYRIDLSQGPLEIVYGNDTAAMWQDGDERKIQA